MLSRRTIALAVGLVLAGLMLSVAPAGATQPECQVLNLSQKKLFYNSNGYVDPLGTAIAEATAGDTLQVIGTCRETTRSRRT